MVDQIIDCSLYDDNLSNRQTRMDNNKLNEIVAKCTKKVDMLNPVNSDWG